MLKADDMTRMNMKSTLEMNNWSLISSGDDSDSDGILLSALGNAEFGSHGKSTVPAEQEGWRRPLLSPLSLLVS